MSTFDSRSQTELPDDLLKTIFIHYLYDQNIPNTVLDLDQEVLIDLRQLVLAISSLLFVNKRIHPLVPYVMSTNVIQMLLIYAQSKRTRQQQTRPFNTQIRSNADDGLLLFLAQCPRFSIAVLLLEFRTSLMKRDGSVVPPATLLLSSTPVQIIVARFESQFRNYFDFFLNHNSNFKPKIPKMRDNETVRSYESRMAFIYEGIEMILHLTPTKDGWLDSEYDPFDRRENLPFVVIDRLVLHSHDYLRGVKSYLNRLLEDEDDPNNNSHQQYTYHAQILLLSILHILLFAERKDLISHILKRLNSCKDHMEYFHEMRVEMLNALLLCALYVGDDSLFQTFLSYYSLKPTSLHLNWECILGFLLLRDRTETILELIETELVRKTPIRYLMRTCYEQRKLDFLFTIASHKSMRFELDPFICYYRDCENENEKARVLRFLHRMLIHLSAFLYSSLLPWIPRRRYLDVKYQKEDIVSVIETLDDEKIPLSFELPKLTSNNAAIDEDILKFFSARLQCEDLHGLTQFLDQYFPFFTHKLSPSYIERAIPFCSPLSLDYLLRMFYISNWKSPPRSESRLNPEDEPKYFSHLQSREIDYSDEVEKRKRLEFFMHYHEQTNPILSVPDHDPIQTFSFNPQTFLPSDIEPCYDGPKFSSIPSLHLFLRCTSIHQLNVVIYYFGSAYRNNMRRFFLTLIAKLIVLPHSSYRTHFADPDPSSDNSLNRQLQKLLVLFDYFRVFIDGDVTVKIGTIIMVRANANLAKSVMKLPMFDAIAIRQSVAQKLIELLHLSRKEYLHLEEKLFILFDFPGFTTSLFETIVLPFQTYISKFSVRFTSELDFSKVAPDDVPILNNIQPPARLWFYHEYYQYLDAYQGDSALIKTLLYCRCYKLVRHLIPTLHLNQQVTSSRYW